MADPQQGVPDGWAIVEDERTKDTTTAPAGAPAPTFPSVEVSRAQSHELPKFTRDLGALEPYRPLIDLAATGVLMGPLVGMAWKTAQVARAALLAKGLRVAGAAADVGAAADAIGLISPRAAHALKLVGKMLGKGASAPATAPVVAEGAAAASAAAAPAPLSAAGSALASRTGTGLQSGVALPRGPAADYYGGRPGPRLVPPAVAPAVPLAGTPAVAPQPPAEPPWVQPPPENAQTIRDAIARNQARSAAAAPPPGPPPEPPVGPPAAPETFPVAPPPVAAPPPSGPPGGTPTVVAKPMSQVWKAMETLKTPLRPNEMPEATARVRDGANAEDVVRQMIAKRKEAEIIMKAKQLAELAEKLGTPSEVDVQERITTDRARAAARSKKPRYGSYQGNYGLKAEP